MFEPFSLISGVKIVPDHLLCSLPAFISLTSEIPNPYLRAVSGLASSGGLILRGLRQVPHGTHVRRDDLRGVVVRPEGHTQPARVPVLFLVIPVFHRARCLHALEKCRNISDTQR